jgi:cyclopropane-fatty-acyl-phospholipid synthase
MSALAHLIRLAEQVPLPDAAVRLAIAAMVARTRQQLEMADPSATAQFAADMMRYPVATNVDDANHQHYEIPASYFALVLGPQRKYSCCLYPDGATTLAEAEDFALTETAAHARLANGQEILELGCGWGSLSLWMARNFPKSRVLAVSNSQSQREHIIALATAEGLGNLEVVTADMNSFTTDRTFDRVVSVEMFEHMANWRTLLQRVRGWLRAEGRLFVHVFAHRRTPYRFDRSNDADWIAQHFFTGGLMPSLKLMHQFGDVFEVEDEWWWNGSHYARTANDWLRRHDAVCGEVRDVLAPVYGRETRIWERRWRFFYLATAGLFGQNAGNDWGVGHYLMRPIPQLASATS